MSAELKLDITELVRVLARQWRHYQKHDFVTGSPVDDVVDGLYIATAHDIMLSAPEPTFVYVVGPEFFAFLSLKEFRVSQLGEHDVWATTLTQEEVYQMVNLFLVESAKPEIAEAIEKLMARHRVRNGGA